MNARTNLLEKEEPSVFNENGELLDKEMHRAIQRELWVLNGVLEHDFPIAVL